MNRGLQHIVNLIICPGQHGVEIHAPMKRGLQLGQSREGQGIEFALQGSPDEEGIATTTAPDTTPSSPRCRGVPMNRGLLRLVAVELRDLGADGCR